MDINGKSSYSSLVNVTCEIRNNAITSVSIFPNPAHDFLTLSIKNLAGNKNVMIYNAIAQEMIHYTISDETIDQQFNVSTFAKGIYILRIDINNKLYNIIKFVI